MLDTYIDNPVHGDHERLTLRLRLLENKLRENEIALKALYDSEKRYRRLFEAAHDGILILEAETGKVVDANPFLLSLLGYTHEKMCGKYIWDIGVFKDIAASKDAFKTLQETSYIRYEDLPLETLCGKPISVEFVSNVYLVDHHHVIQCNIRDITERKQGEAERKLLTTAIEQTGEAIAITDDHGIIQFVNPAFETMTCFGRSEAVGQHMRIFNSAMQDDSFYDDIWRTISGGKTWDGQMKNKLKDGSFCTETCSISPVRDTLGVIVNYVVVKRDITQHLRLMAQSQQAQKMEAVGLLAGGVAHDYNNMLNVIMGYAEMGLGKVAVDHPLHSDLEKIIKAALHSKDITQQLMGFARKQTIIPVVFDLNRNVENMFQMLQKIIGENIDLNWVPCMDSCHVKMDHSQIDQILVNLCINARDAISDIGKVTIRAKNTVIHESDRLDYGEILPGAYVLLSVQDNGCGMSRDVMDHIFEPFFTSKALGKGTGLGLSTVYGIVKQNNGFIYVDSEPGKGTTFKIFLPSFTDQILDTRVKVPTEIQRGQGETILVVEDEPMLLDLNKRILEKLGYRVLAAGLPSEALAIVETYDGAIDLVLTDMVMPEMNGMALADRLQLQIPGIPIMFMSGYAADVIPQRRVTDEAMTFIQKPFTASELTSKIRAVIDQ